MPGHFLPFQNPPCFSQLLRFTLVLCLFASQALTPPLPWQGWDLLPMAAQDGGVEPKKPLLSASLIWAASDRRAGGSSHHHCCFLQLSPSSPEDLLPHQPNLPKTQSPGRSFPCTVPHCLIVLIVFQTLNLSSATIQLFVPQE